MITDASIISTISISAQNNTPEKQREAYEAQIRQRIEDCLKIDEAELNKKAIDLGKSAHEVIDAAISKLRTLTEDYVNSHIEEIVRNHQEVLHISELEARSTTKEYRNGKIVADLQRIVVFQRG